MNAAILPLPDAVSGFAVARSILDTPPTDPEAVEAACDVLGPSEWYMDVIRVRRGRAWVGARNLAESMHSALAKLDDTSQPGEVRDAAASLLLSSDNPEHQAAAHRWMRSMEIRQPSRDCGEHLGNLKLPGKPLWRPWLTAAAIGITLAVAAHVAIAAPAKVARTVAIHEQIEAGR